MTRYAALDLTPARARWVVIDRTLRRSELVGVDTLAREEDEERGDFFLRVRAALPTGIDSLIASADAGAFSTRLINFPFGDMRKVEQTLDFELEQQIPYDLEEVISSSHVTNRQKHQTTMLTAVTPRDRLGERIADFAAADLEPRAIVLQGGALAELMATKSVEPVAIVSLGASESHVCVIDATSGLRFARSVRAGGNAVDRSIANTFKLTLAEARMIKEEEGRIIGSNEVAGEEETRLSAALVAGAAPILSALATTFRSLPPELSPTEVMLTGGLSRLPGLAEFIGERLGIDVTLLDLGDALTGIDHEQGVGPEFAVALGMALAMIRRGRTVPLNLRQGPFAYSGDIQLYRGEILKIGIGIGLVMLLALIGSIVRYSMVTAVESEIQSGICAATKKIIGREICDPTAAIATLRAAPGAEDGVVIPEYSAASLYEMISKALGQDIDVSFSSLDFRINSGAGEPDKITGKGEAASFETTEQIVAAIKKDPCVQEAKVDKQKKKGERVEFNLIVEVRCTAGMMPGSPFEAVAAIAPPPTTKATTTTEVPPRSAPPRTGPVELPTAPVRPPGMMRPDRGGAPYPPGARGPMPGVRPSAPGMPVPPGVAAERQLDKRNMMKDRGHHPGGPPGRPLPPTMVPRGMKGPRTPGFVPENQPGRPYPPRRPPSYDRRLPPRTPDKEE